MNNIQLKLKKENMDQENQGFQMEESQEMNRMNAQLFLNFRRSKSDDSFLGKLIQNKGQTEKRPLIFSIANNDQNNSFNQNSFHVFRKIKKQKKKNLCDYRKNICGYITKKIIREFTGPNYTLQVKKICQEESCEYQAVKVFYQAKIQHVTGPSHIPNLLKPDNQREIPIKNVFKRFFEWFLRERYLRYLLLEGKMADKKAYIEYKNTILLSMVESTTTEKQEYFVKQEHQSEN